MGHVPQSSGRSGPDDGDLPEAIRGLKRASVLVVGNAMLESGSSTSAVGAWRATVWNFW